MPIFVCGLSVCVYGEVLLSCCVSMFDPGVSEVAVLQQVKGQISQYLVWECHHRLHDQTLCGTLSFAPFHLSVTPRMYDLITPSQPLFEQIFYLH